MDFGGLLAGAIGFGLLVIVPVVAIMTEHQRKMAKILRGQLDQEGGEDRGGIVIGVHADLGKKNKGPNPSSADPVLDELRSMRNELADLRLQVATLQGGRTEAPQDDDSMRRRLSQGC